MAHTKTVVLEGVESNLEQMFGSDKRLEDEVKALVWFGGYAWDSFRQANSPLRGFSIKTSQSGTLLTVRWIRDDRPVVSFISGVHPSDCIRMLYRMWFADELSATDDKFA